MTVEIFISYSHKDEAEKNELLQHLRVLRSRGLIDLWSDERIGVGEEWKTEIDEALTRANVAILLVTRNFLNSDFILEREVPEILRRREQGLTIIPIIATHCAWRSVDWLAELKAFNDGLPVWRDGAIHVDKELTEITYLVEGNVAQLTSPSHVSVAASAHIHILYIAPSFSSPTSGRSWLSSLLQRPNSDRPTMMPETLIAAINAEVSASPEQIHGQLNSQSRDDGIIVATNGDVAALLRLAIKIMRVTRSANGACLRMALHSGEIGEFSLNQDTGLTCEDVYVARRLMGLGSAGHLLASQQAAELLRKNPEFASLFHISGRRTIEPPDSIEIYNVYKRSAPLDEAVDFGNDSPPLSEAPETIVRKFDAPERLRAGKDGWVRIVFNPAQAYIKIKFDFKNTDDEKARGVRIGCHKHGQRACAFEYRINDSGNEHKPRFKIVADDPAADLSLVMEMSLYNEYDELLAPPLRHDIRLLRKPPLPSIKEPLGLFAWGWDRFMRLPVMLRALAFAALVPLLVVVVYFAAPLFIPKEVRDKATNDYEIYKRRYWFGYDTYVGEAWPHGMEDFIDPNPSARWSFDPGQVQIVKGDGEGNVDTGAMLIKQGSKMVVAGDLGSLAFYDFTAEFRLKFVEGEEAAWVLRSQPDRQTGYVFLLKKEGTDLFLYGLKYKGPNQFESIDLEPKHRVLSGGCCYPNDYFDIKAEVINFTFKHQITINNFDDPEAQQTRPGLTIGPYPVSDFTDRQELYRCGSAGVLKPPTSKMQLESWKVTPSPFPNTPAAKSSP